MPLHGLKADLELVFLAVSAAAVSYFTGGQVLGNVFFTSLIASLFFLMGLHVNLEFFKAARTRGREIFVCLVGIYIFAPLIAYLFSYIPGSIGEAVLVIGISASAFGSPKIWANLSNSDGELASYAASFSLFGSILMIPLLLYFLPLEVNSQLLLENSVFAVIPFLAGVVSQNLESQLIQNLRLHFSKLCFWLIVLITFLQARLLLNSESFISFSALLLSSLAFFAFSVMSFGYPHLFSRFAGFYEKEARSIGYISSSKSIGVALLIGSQISGKVVFLVCLYYFVRQFTGVLITDLYLHGEPKIAEKIGF